MSTLTAQATNNSSDFKKILSTMKGHLLFGTSHMLPFIVAGGVLLALAVMASGKGAVLRTVYWRIFLISVLKVWCCSQLFWVASSVIPLQTNQHSLQQ